MQIFHEYSRQEYGQQISKNEHEGRRDRTTRETYFDCQWKIMCWVGRTN